MCPRSDRALEDLGEICTSGPAVAILRDELDRELLEEQPDIGDDASRLGRTSVGELGHRGRVDVHAHQRDGRREDVPGRDGVQHRGDHEAEADVLELRTHGALALDDVGVEDPRAQPVLRAGIDPGDVILVELPTYVGAITAFGGEDAPSAIMIERCRAFEGEPPRNNPAVRTRAGQLEDSIEAYEKALAGKGYGPVTTEMAPVLASTSRFALPRYELKRRDTLLDRPHLATTVS